MSQTYTTDCFAGAHVAQTDLANMEANFAALKSMFSGASAPSNTLAGCPWFDTTKKVMKQRNNADSAWLGLMHGDVSQKLWVYRNAAMDGWAIDSGVSDVVLALKGGSTYTAGAATAGSWTISGLTVNPHIHYLNQISPGFDAVSSRVVTDGTSIYVQGSSVAGGFYSITRVTDNGSSNTIAGDASHRPLAAVGTLQYLDL